MRDVDKLFFQVTVSPKKKLKITKEKLELMKIQNKINILKIANERIKFQNSVLEGTLKATSKYQCRQN